MTGKIIVLFGTYVVSLIILIVSAVAGSQAVHLGIVANAAVFIFVLNENEKLTATIRRVRSSCQDCIDSLIDRIQVLENRIKGK